MERSILQTKQLVTILIQHFTEEEIAINLDLSFAELRQYLKGPLPITEAVWEEITIMHPDESNFALSKFYNTTMYQISKWANGYRPKIKLNQQQKQEVILSCSSLKDASKLLGESMNNIRKQIPKKQMPNISAIKTMEGTHAEIAKKLGVSRSWVTRHISENKKASTPNKIKDRDAVLEYRKANSLKATAEHFGVSPSSISHWIKRHGKQIDK